MSEAAGASGGSSSAGTAAASVTPASSANESAGTAQNRAAVQGEQGDSKSTPKTGSENPQGGDGFEEIKIGSVSGRVTKEIAQALKNLERGFNSKAQEAANTKKLLSLAQENPKEFFKQTGKDAYDFAEELLAEKYEMMNMSPEARELKELKAREAERAKAESASKQEVIDALKQFGPVPEGAESATREQLIKYYHQQKQAYERTQTSLDTELGEAFKESGLPTDRQLAAKVAFEMMSALKRGKSLSAKEAVAKVSSEYFSGMKGLLGTMDVKRIHEVLGDEFLDKVRKYDLEQVTAQTASRFGQPSQSPGQRPASEEPKKKYMNEIEWRKHYGLR